MGRVYAHGADGPPGTRSTHCTGDGYVMVRPMVVDEKRPASVELTTVMPRRPVAAVEATATVRRTVVELTNVTVPSVRPVPAKPTVMPGGH